MNHLKYSFQVLFCMALVNLFAISCIDKKDLSEPSGPGNVDLAPTLDFATKKNVRINLDYAVADFCVEFEIYTQNPIFVDEFKTYSKDKSLLARVQGKTDKNGRFSLPVEVAALTDEIFVYSPSVHAGVPKLMREKIVGDEVSLLPAKSTVDLENLPMTRAGKDWNTSDDCCYGWAKFDFTYQTLGDWDANGKPLNMGERIDFSEVFSNALNRFLPAMEDNDHLHETELNQPVITLSEEVENVRLHFVKHNSGRKNALAYYTYTDNLPSEADVNKSLMIAYPNLSASSGLQPGDCVQLKYRDGASLSDRFPKGAKIAFAVILDAYNGGELETPSHIIYSDQRFNKYNFKETDNHSNSLMANRPHAVTFKADGHFVIAIEDLPRGGTLKGSTENTVYHPADYSDDVFVLYSDPVTALPPTTDVTPQPEPDEPEPDFVVNSSGYYAFEDMWPKVGDYDMNDVIVKYTRILNCNKEFNVTGIDETFEFINNGATTSNAFGYEIKPVKRSNIKVLENIVTSEFTYPNQGLDKEMNNATIMLFDNGRKVPKGTLFNVKLRFTVPVSYMNFMSPPNNPSLSPFNPFIVVSGYGDTPDILKQNRLEVHLPKCTPTSKADMSLFGTADDISDVEKGLYYVCKGGKYPFALELTSNNSKDEFVVPVEGQALDVKYPKYNSWVQNGCGQKDSDWYLFPTGNTD